MRSSSDRRMRSSGSATVASSAGATVAAAVSAIALSLCLLRASGRRARLPALGVRDDAGGFGEEERLSCCACVVVWRERGRVGRARKKRRTLPTDHLSPPGLLPLSLSPALSPHTDRIESDTHTHTHTQSAVTHALNTQRACERAREIITSVFWFARPSKAGSLSRALDPRRAQTPPRWSIRRRTPSPWCVGPRVALGRARGKPPRVAGRGFGREGANRPLASARPTSSRPHTNLTTTTITTTHRSRSRAGQSA